MEMTSNSTYAVPASAAHSAAGRLNPPVANPRRGPRPAARHDEPTDSPCTECPERTSCQKPCAALEAILPRPHRPSLMEFGSEALMRGRLRAGASLPAVQQEELEARPDHRRWIRALRRALDELPHAHRQVVAAHFGGASRAAVAKACGTSAQVVDTVLQQSLRSLRDALTTQTPENDNATTTNEDAMQTTMLTVGPMTGIPCAELGCTNIVSSRPPSHPTLAAFCTTHRRLKMWHDKRGVAAEQAPIAAKVEPTSEDRASVDALVARVANKGPGIVQITPVIATVLLERNTSNRAVAKNRVDVYARDMLAGAWYPNSQGIAIGPGGELYDGQHRLWAVVSAGIAVPMLMVCGVSEAARATIDQGRTRSLGDNLRILDGHVDGVRIAAWLRAIETLKTRTPKPLSHAMVRELLKHYEGSARWFSGNGLQRRPLYQAPLAGALLYAHCVAPTEVEHFTRRYVSGADLPEGSPVLALREYIVSTHDGSRPVSLKVLRALLADIRGERLDRLYATEDGFVYFRDRHAAKNISAAA